MRRLERDGNAYDSRCAVGRSCPEKAVEEMYFIPATLPMSLSEAIAAAISDGSLQDRQRIAALFERPARDADSIGGVELFPDRLATDAAFKQISVKIEDAADVGGVFVEELDAEVSHSAFKQTGDDFGSTLRDRVEQRVAAADIGVQRMLAPHAIAKLDEVRVARTAAVVLVRPR